MDEAVSMNKGVLKVQTIRSQNIHAFVNAVIECIPEEADFGAADKKAAAGVVRACVMALYPHDFSKAEIAALLSNLDNGYGCWLETVGTALHKGLIQFTDESEECLRGRVKGSFLMAQQFIWEKHKHLYEQ